RGLGTGRCETAGAGRTAEPSAGWIPPSPGFRGRPPRLCLARVERGNPDGGPRRFPARWADREEGRSLGGNRMAKKRMPVRRKATGNRGHCGGDPRRRSRITGRIRADARPERALTWPGGLVENRSQVAPEPKDKLDAMTLDTLEPACARPAVDAVVNGPEGECPDWLSIDWRQAEDDVRRLRQRIFTASRAGD